MLNTDTVAVCTLIKSYFYDPSPEELAEVCINKAKPGDKYFGMSKDTILSKWNERKEEGITLHKNIEKNFENSCVCEYIKSYTNSGYTKHNEMNLSLQTNKYLIRGRADCVFINESEKKIIITEWKNCKFYYLKSDNKGFGPCSKLNNTKFTKHILQSELYKKLLENTHKDYNIVSEIVYINNNKIDKIVKPYDLAIQAVNDIIKELNDLNK